MLQGHYRRLIGSVVTLKERAPIVGGLLAFLLLISYLDLKMKQYL